MAHACFHLGHIWVRHSMRNVNRLCSRTSEPTTPRNSAQNPTQVTKRALLLRAHLFPFPKVHLGFGPLLITELVDRLSGALSLSTTLPSLNRIKRLRCVQTCWRRQVVCALPALLEVHSENFSSRGLPD